MVHDVVVARKVAGGFRVAIPAALLFAADGWIAAGYVFVWQIALFLSLGESLFAYGGALAIAALVGAAGGLALGRHIDAGHGKRAVWYAFGTFALIIALRALATGNATAAVVANALGSLGGCLYIPTLMTAVYTQAKRSPCTLRYHVVTEGGWDIGGAHLKAARLEGGRIVKVVQIASPLWLGMEELHRKLVDHRFSKKDWDGDQFVRLRTLKRHLNVLNNVA